MLKFIFIGLIFINFACTSAKKETVQKSEKTEIDNVDISNEAKVNLIVNYPVLLQKTHLKYKTLNLPFKADSAYFKKFKAGKGLKDEEIKLLVSNFTESKDYTEGYIYDVVRLNHLKQMDQYEEYVNSLDLAQLKDANANIIGKIERNDSSFILWSVDYSSYEACPFYSGTEIYCSFIQDGIVKKCLKLGEYSIGGDAPVHGETFSTFTINKDFSVQRRIHSAYYEDDVLQEKKSSKDMIKL